MNNEDRGKGYITQEELNEFQKEGPMEWYRMSFMGLEGILELTLKSLVPQTPNETYERTTFKKIGVRLIHPAPKPTIDYKNKIVKIGDLTFQICSEEVIAQPHENLD